MILKKPYAFIIKHFRLIHLFLLACFGFIYSNMNDIYGLLNQLQQTHTYMYVGTDNYIHKEVYYFIFGALALCGIVYWLLKKKKKPTVMYLAMIIYLVASFVGFAYLFGQLKSIQDELIEIDHLIFIKDVSTILTLPNYVFLVVCIVRGVGFNLKKFNFSKDIAELQIADVDSEEFEVLIGQNNYKYMRFIRRTIRETKYYILENKFMLLVFLSVVLTLSAGFGIYYYQKYVKRMGEAEATSVNGITYTVKNSYMTSLDYTGDIVKKSYKYVVVNMTFYNSNQFDKTIDLEKITLTNGDLVYYPILTRNGKFYDLGMPYSKGEVIHPGEDITRTLTFEIPSSVTSTDFTLRVQYEIENGSEDINALYRKFKLKAPNIDAEPIKYFKNLNESVNTNVEGVNQYDIIVRNYSIQDSYNNKYVRCSSLSKCETMSELITSTKTGVNTMLIVNYEDTMYNEANFTKKFNTSNKIFNSYVYVNYTVDKKNYTVPATIVPKTNVDNMVFLQVDRNIKKASKISLTFNFRNNKFNVTLK